MRFWNIFVKLLTEIIPVILLCVVTTIIAIDVVARTAFSRPVFAAAEIALISFVWLVWLGAVGVARRGEMMGISYFVDHMGPLKRPAQILSDVLVVGIAGFCAYATYRQVSTARFTVFETLELPKWILAVGVGISLVLFVIIYIQRLYRTLTGRPQDHAVSEDPL